MQAYEYELTGYTIAEDAGYHILSGLSAKMPSLHGRTSMQIAPVNGNRCEQGLRLHRNSRLHIRGLSAAEADLLSQNWLMVGPSMVGLGKAKPVRLTPTASLVSRIVVFEDAVDEQDFLMRLAQVAPVGCTMTRGRSRTIRVKDRSFIGYGVRLDNLSPEDATAVLSSGIGRFTSMGCGVFAPATRKDA